MSDTKTISFYDDKADDYRELVSRTEPDADLCAFMAAVPTGGRILDLGCGPGNSAFMMANAGFTVDATDASAEMVKIAASMTGVNAFQATFNDLDDIDKYHGLWANFCLLHADRKDIPDYLSRIHTALKPNGIFHLGLKIGAGAQRDKLGRMYTYFETDEVKTLLANANFTIRSLRIGEMEGMAGDIEPYMIVLAYA